MNIKRIISEITINNLPDARSVLDKINEHLENQRVPLYSLDVQSGCLRMECNLTDKQVEAIDLYVPSEILSASIVSIAERYPSANIRGKLYYCDGDLSEIALASYAALGRELCVEYVHEGDEPACPCCETSCHDFADMYELEEIYLPDECPYCGEEIDPSEYWNGDYCLFKCVLTKKGWKRTYEVDY